MFIPLDDLKLGQEYQEIIPDEEDGETKVLILANIPGEVISVYLIGYYDLTEKGKEFLLAAPFTENGLSDLLETIPIEDYRSDNFFEKYGFYDEAIIFYDTFPAFDKVNNEYVGDVFFEAIPEEKPIPELVWEDSIRVLKLKLTILWVLVISLLLGNLWLIYLLIKYIK